MSKKTGASLPITAGEFLEAFRETWCAGAESRKIAVAEKFEAKDSLWTGWTKYMLTDDDSFLRCVAVELGFPRGKKGCTEKNVHYTEYNRIDMVLMRDYNGDYPYMFDVLIEHENDQHPENEMWKLMLLRAQLKVIIFYGHTPEDKLKQMSKMLKKANAAFPENPATEYLFIIGNLIGKQEPYPMQWRWASEKSDCPQTPLTKLEK